MPARYRLLMHCPFCRGDVETDFDRSSWRLVHLCQADECPWTNGPLPFFVVDDEIYRYLPTVIVGTLDKAASMGLQQAMRGATRWSDSEVELMASFVSRQNRCKY